MSMALFIVGKIMLRYLFLLVAVASSLGLLSCVGIRNRDVYSMEVIFLEQSLMAQNDLVRKYLESSCCLEGKFMDEINCSDALDTYVTIRERLIYHTDKMRYLGRLSEHDPELPKLEITSEGICE